MRVTIDLVEHQAQRLDEIEQQTGLTKAGVMREALMLYDYVVQLASQGKQLQSVSGDGTTETVVILSGVAGARK